MLPVTQIDTFYNRLTLRHRDTINAVAGGTFMKRRLEECYDLIENMTAHHNDWDTLAQRSELSSSITSSSDSEIVALKAEMAEINKNLMRVLQVNQQVKAVTPNCETCGGHHSYNDCPATVGQTQNLQLAVEESRVDEPELGNPRLDKLVLDKLEPPLAKPRTYMLREPIKVVIPTNLKFEDQSLYASRPSRLCAQPQSEDDMPFHKQACMKYTQWVFCKLFERTRERHLACPTRMHDFRPLSFQGFVLNHGLIPPPDHLFGGDTGTQQSNLALESFLAKRYLRAEWSVYTMLLFMMRTAPIAESLASHMSSKGKSQLGAIKIGASVSFLLSV
nr:reverse transcriptase domain-containing protein [Tanacetum cinerariifolium]